MPNFRIGEIDIDGTPRRDDIVDGSAFENADEVDDLTRKAMDANTKKTTLRMIPYGIYVLTADDGKGKIAAAIYGG